MQMIMVAGHALEAPAWEKSSFSPSIKFLRWHPSSRSCQGRRHPSVFRQSNGTISEVKLIIADVRDQRSVGKRGRPETHGGFQRVKE